MTERKVITREASELGWAPGFVPYLTSVDNVPYEFKVTIMQDCVIVGWEYVSSYAYPEEIILKVWND